jgi:ankyrin repeat protein
MDKVDYLLKACFEGSLPKLRRQLKDKRDINRKYRRWTLLRLAIQEGHLEIVKFLVNKGANFKRKYSDGFTPLDQAVGEGHYKIIEFLINSGVDVNQKTANGTALHTASAYGKFTIAKMLVKNGANVKIKDSSGLTPRWYAGYFRHAKLSTYLQKQT